MTVGRLRFALADDESVVREYLEETLTDLGHEVVGSVDNGRALVELCRQHLPDLVISDVRMPDMDGLEAAQLVAEHRPTPFIIVSAFHDATLLARAENSCILAYLVKPIGRPDIETAITIAHQRFVEFEALRQETRELRQALEDRKLIERAKGILMQRNSLTEEEAFRRLRQTARDENLKLAELARMILLADKAHGDPSGSTK